MKRLAVFLDGTWNNKDDSTNVWRSKLMLAERDGQGVEQRAYYDTGVGTHWTNRLRGGVFAKGLSKNVREAYGWLMEQYDPGAAEDGSDADEIYVFGFSRGAYTARSLTGMIAKVGLLKPSAPMSVSQVFDRYKRASQTDTSDKVRALWKLKQFKKGPPDFPDAWTPEDRWVYQYSHDAKIKYIGVWDTVGALGLPFGRIKGISASTLLYHHTRPSNAFLNMYHALAIDEHRKPYRPTLWEGFYPRNPKTGEPIEKPLKEGQSIEQRWFVGAHSNVGGGYPNNALATVPLAWLQEKARGLGLAFRDEIKLLGDEHREAEVVDSYASFLKGLYRIIKFGRRHYRAIGRDWVKKETGWVHSFCETIDETVFDRWQHDQSYRPENLKTWAERNDVDLATVTGEQPVVCRQAASG